MEILIIVLLIVVFLIWPTFGVIYREITIKGFTFERDEKPLYFWGTVVFLYLCAAALSVVVWKGPFI